MGIERAGRPGRGRTWRTHRLALSLCAALALITSLLVPASGTAVAMTAISEPQGYPGEEVTAQVRNDLRGPPYAPWNITAPPGTEIVSAASDNPPGSVPFTCTGDAAAVHCGSGANGGWAVGNVVSLVLRIVPDAVAGETSGRSEIAGSESGAYTVTVLPPPAPEIAAPSPGSTRERQPLISGTKRPGNSAEAFIDDEPVCEVPADGESSWSCAPASEMQHGAHLITARQTSPGGDVSDASEPVVVDVLADAALTLAQRGQATAEPGERVERTITLVNEGEGAAEETRVEVDGGTFPARECTLDGDAAACDELAQGLVVATLEPGRTVLVTVVGRIPEGTPAGTEYTFTARARSDSDPDSPVLSTRTLVVTAPTPTPIPLPIPTLTPTPSPSPS
ncbi:hypothetical protein G3H63_01685, partial [Microbacterium resistens]|nr:hypothetical protein [Microbacterium resistens]